MTTSSVISTPVTNTTETVSGSGDDLLVTGAGSIVNTNGADAIDSNETDQGITIDGFVYSVDGFNGNAVDLSSASSQTSVFVNGQVQGDTGVWANGPSNVSISVGSQGSIQGLYDGVLLEGTGDVLRNAGDIAATLFSADNAGVAAENGGVDTINNSGQISGNIGFFLSENANTDAVNNSGTIEGVDCAIESIASSAGVDIINSGLLTNLIGGLGVVSLGDDGGVTSLIDNTGTINGSGYVIQSFADILDIANSGTIHGGLYSVGSVDVENAGLWEGQAGSAVVVFDLLQDDDVLTNSRAGTIDGGITLVGGHDTLTNAGGIDGAITFIGTTATNKLTNSGKITGNIVFGGGGDTIDNSGTIDGSITVAHADNHLTNTGAIDGSITLAAGTNPDTLTNSDKITGNIEMSAVDSKLTNHGQIYGNVTLAADSTLTNTGTIHGDVTLGATDTFDVSPGTVTGEITGSSKGGDVFEFSGNFGNETVAKFVGGTGSTHDTIQFAANDFSSYSAFASQMSQMGADVLIRLDATDSITLTNTTLSNLSATDFKFV